MRISIYVQLCGLIKRDYLDEALKRVIMFIFELHLIKKLWSWLQICTRLDMMVEALMLISDY